MKKYNFLKALFILTIGAPLNVAAVENFYRFPDISDDQITFVYAEALWLAPKSGGRAKLLVQGQGEISFPRFSSDGERIAYSATQNGNQDVYLMNIKEKSQRRLTSHPDRDRLIDWYPKSEKLLYATPMTSERQRYNQLYSLSIAGGTPVKLPVPYGEKASISSDERWLAYTQIHDTFDMIGPRGDWKRYRGGQSPDIWLYDLEKNIARNIAPDPAVDSIPMWHGDRIFFLSERGESRRANLWVYDKSNEEIRQVTFFKKFDVREPAIGPDSLVFHAGGKLYSLELDSGDCVLIKIEVETESLALKPSVIPVGHMIRNASLSPDGREIAFEARGELFIVPARSSGKFTNLTKASGSAERYPSWSPDNKNLAYLSDKSGEYELIIHNRKENKVTERINLGHGYRYKPQWSPDGNKLVFTDHTMSFFLYNLRTKQSTKIDARRWLMDGTAHGMLQKFRVSWSPDSRWIAYSRGLDNRNEAIFIFDTEAKVSHQVTSGFYNDHHPVFSLDGHNLYFLTSRNFEPVYSDLEPGWTYVNSTRIAVIPLSPEPDYSHSKVRVTQTRYEKLRIDFNKAENRVMLLSPTAGNYDALHALNDKLVYIRRPRTGSLEKENALLFFDIQKNKEHLIASNVELFDISSQLERAVVKNKDNFYLLAIRENARLGGALKTDKLEMKLDEPEEWQQLLMDAWRFQRDYFYDGNLHGLDWLAILKRYQKIMSGVSSRVDAYFVIREMVTEIGAGHMYVRRGRDPGIVKQEKLKTGMLGINLRLAGDYYQIAEILDTGIHASQLRSPLSFPGLNISEGDYILKADGKMLNNDGGFWPVFSELENKEVTLLVNDKPEVDGAREVKVKALSLKEEYLLRELSWAERNRRLVHKLSEGKIGYIYVPNTVGHGQNELMRQFRAQFSMPALIIDERFNAGGALGDRFVELLNRPLYNYLSVRHGNTFHIPEIAHTGYKVMLINGWSGSGGDGFPYYFRQAGLGPIIGMPTWGGLVGPSDYLQLIDGGYVSAPPSRFYSIEGEWVVEGEGVKPDITIVNNPVLLWMGQDQQLEKAVEVLSEKLETLPVAKVTDPMPPIEHVH